MLSHPDSGRPVPVREYRPEHPKAWVIFSVGYGGQSTGYGYLARRWASEGIATLVTEHVGSNLDVLKSFSHLSQEERNREVVRRVQDPEELRRRPWDMALVRDSFQTRYSGLALGLAGHSFGSYSVLAACGLKPRQVNPGLRSLQPSATILLSPQPPGMLFAAEEYGEVDCPTLVLTGTEDHLLSGSATYRDRLRVFECLPKRLARLLVQEGTDHMALAGIGLKIEPHLSTAKAATVEWWRTNLLGEGSTADWCGRLEQTIAPERIHQCL